MKPYLALARAAAKVALNYRLSFVLSLFGTLFQLVAMLAVWHVLLEKSAINGFTWEQMRWYLLVGFASGALVGLFADFEMAYRIRNGMIALDLIKPVRYQEARFAQVLGALWIEAAVVVLVGGITVLTSGPPVWPNAPTATLFVVSMLLLIMLKFLVLYLCGLACFWTQNYMGVQWARIAVVNLLSGAIVPISLLPRWLGSIAEWSPFAGMTSTPGLIMAGRIQGMNALLMVAVQLGWAMVLWYGAKLIWRVAVRQLTVNGG